MAQVQPNEIKIFLAATDIPAPDDEATTIGGAISAVEMSDVQGDILDDITIDKTADKDRYTKVFVKNEGSVTAVDVSVFLSSAEPANHTWLLGKENTPGDTATQSITPSGVSFVAQDGTTAGRVTLGDIAAAASVGFWVKLIAGQNAVTANNIDWDFKVEWV